jgi:hypothetical protein
MADAEPERLILGQDVMVSPGHVRRLSLVLVHRVVDPELAAARGIGLRDRLLSDLWDLMRRTFDETALHALVTDDDDARPAACDQLRGPVGETLRRHGSTLVDLSLDADVGEQRDPLADLGRARAADAADAADLMAQGVVAHTRFDAAGEAAS